MTIYILCK